MEIFSQQQMFQWKTLWFMYFMTHVCKMKKKNNNFVVRACLISSSLIFTLHAYTHTCHQEENGFWGDYFHQSYFLFLLIERKIIYIYIGYCKVQMNATNESLCNIYTDGLGGIEPVQRLNAEVWLYLEAFCLCIALHQHVYVHDI